MTLLTWLSLMLATAAMLLTLANFVRAELQGPDVRLRLVSGPAPDGWSVSQDGPAEISGACVALLSNAGSAAGAAWDFRVTVGSPLGTCEAVAAVVPAGGDASATPNVIPVEPRSSLGLLVTIWLPVDAARRTGGDLRVSIDCGATGWPWGRAARRSSALSIPYAEIAAAMERWTSASGR